MKNALPISLFLVLFLTDFFIAQVRILPGIFVYFPEAFYAVIGIIAISRIIARKKINIPARYIIAFMCFMYVVIAGITLNDISTLTVISGIRAYFKYIPIFLLPFAYDYSISDLKKQFVVLLSLGLLQLPVALWQSSKVRSFDLITGTLGISNSLSIIMITLIITLLALYLSKKISLIIFIILSIILFIPTTLNETKITPVLLVIGFGALLFTTWKILSLKQITTFMVSGIALLVIFITIYDTLLMDDDSSFSNNMSSDRLVKNYNYTEYKADPNSVFDTDTKITGEVKDLPTLNYQTGRIDSILIPLDVFANNDVIRLFFGFGISNVHSLGGGAKYIHLGTMKANQTTIAQLLWETGILGTFLFVLIMFFVARDALFLAGAATDWRAFSSAWFAITIVLIASLVYTNLFAFDELICLFMYFSSTIIVRRHLAHTYISVSSASMKV